MHVKILGSLIGATTVVGLSGLTASADVVVTTDGSELIGEIVEVSDRVVRLETAYAGELEIDRELVSRFESDDAESVRLEDGNVLIGPVSSDESGLLRISTGGGIVTTPIAEVVSVWNPGDRDPEVLAREAELVSQMRRWSYETAVSIAGKSGNSETTDIAASAAAKLEGPSDRLDIYASYEYGTEEAEVGGETIDTRSADEAILGMAYTSFFSEHYGWYLREEVEYDTFENIEFRSTTAAGLTYRVFDRETHSLEGRAGLSYRYESYNNQDFNGDGIIDAQEAEDGSEGFPGLDFGLTHYWQFATWGEMKNSLTYTPSVDDFADYLIDHKSAVDIPLGSSDFWKLRFGLTNQYNSSPTAGRERLDTTYSLSLLLNWR